MYIGWAVHLHQRQQVELKKVNTTVTESEHLTIYGEGFVLAPGTVRNNTTC